MMKRARLAVLTALLVLAATSVGAGGGDMIEDGAVFPQFKLEAHDGSTVTSSTLKGTPYLIYFYPKADTPGCTREACELRDSWSDLKEAGLSVFGVSFDTPKKNAAFAGKHRLPFLLLSDSDRELADATGAKPMLLPFPKRISYLVDDKGVVLKAYPKVVPADHASEVLRDFLELTGE